LIQHILQDSKYQSIYESWKIFLQPYDYFNLKIIYDSLCPHIFDQGGRRFQIDFENNIKDYQKFKNGPRTEILSRALGGLKLGTKLLDLSAGLGVDAVFLAQLGYDVIALERNPIVYLSLAEAHKNWTWVHKEKVRFIFSDAKIFLTETEQKYDICYFDPMFPSKKKSALPKQEMLFFKDLVGNDEDGFLTLQTALQSQKFKRIVVKRPMSAEPFKSEHIKKSGSIEGKIVRYDIYTN
jgi:16S rRNA (guanine1516-N2)-methyltransferase